MPSAITHILLVKNLQSKELSTRLSATLAAGKYFLQVGAVGPDLPYSSQASVAGLLFGDDSELADKFHYERANQIPLIALKKIKNSTTFTVKERRYLFNFFAGYISHIVADGVIHPFVRDKVGNYSEHKTEHRTLEMRLDVLLNNYFTKKSGKPTEYNYTDIHEELLNIHNAEESHVVVEVFKTLIKETYNMDFNDEDITDWINGLYNLISAAEGNHLAIYRNLSILDGLIFKNFSDLELKKDKLIILKAPSDGVANNFMHKEQIHFFNDCIPQFYDRFIPILKKAYAYIYHNGSELTDEDIPSIDLDTGREEMYANNLDMIPVFWS